MIELIGSFVLALTMSFGSMPSAYSQVPSGGDTSNPCVTPVSQDEESGAVTTDLCESQEKTNPVRRPNPHR